MPRTLRMSRGMAVERIVAATDVTAAEADAQVHPFVARPLAVFAADGACGYVAGFIEVAALVAHRVYTFSQQAKA